MNNKNVLGKYSEILLLLLISALVYLPNIHRLGYYKDDWYLMYLAHTQGPEIFRDIFSIDRPARGELMLFLYRLFGDHALYYNLSAYFFRVLSSLGFLGILRMIWPSRKVETFMMTILFMVYPGYLSQINAIDFQSHMVSLCFAVFSIGLSLQAMYMERPWKRYVMTTISILLGWAYLGLVEYSIGLELFRFACFYIILSRGVDKGFIKKISETARKSMVYLAIPVGFLFWRLLLFQNERRATDVGSQLGELISSPILTGPRWAITLLQDFLNVTFLAWGVPLYEIGFQLRLRDSMIGLGIGILILLVIRVFHTTGLFQSSLDVNPNWRTEALQLGFITVIASALPVIVANRHVDFSEYSRYGLPGSVGGVLILASLLHYVDPPRVRVSITYALIIIASLTHFANIVRAANQFDSVRQFWWQVSWRIPQIKEGTTLVAHYANSGVPEDYVVWGPANLIYYPEKHIERPVRLALSAIVLSNENIARISTSAGNDERLGRGTISNQNYKNILVISQPAPISCVHVFTGLSPEKSLHEDHSIALVFSYSNPENILVDEAQHIPPEVMFGPEPAHNWCYFYQKAELARQSGNWEEIRQLGNQAQKEKLHPNDPIEWLPFLMAYARLGDEKQVKGISTRINIEDYYKDLTCQIMTSPEALGYSLSSDMEANVRDLFCR